MIRVKLLTWINCIVIYFVTSFCFCDKFGQLDTYSALIVGFYLKDTKDVLHLMQVNSKFGKEQILSKKQQILNNAQAEAKRTISEAEFRAEQLVSSSEIFKKSEQAASDMIERANKKCEQLYSVTKENVDKMLKSVETYLDQNLIIVRRNRDELERTIGNIKHNLDDDE